MKINEIFRSISGESSTVGLPCVFVRLTGCNLRCSYCDSTYSYNEGSEMNITEVYEMVKAFAKNGDILEITGGEPLLQVDEINTLIKKIKSNIPYNTLGDILIETNGSRDIENLKKRDEYNIKVIMDWKSLSSGMSNEMLPSNLEKLTKDDELKFVIGDWEDYNDMKRTIRKYNPKCKVLISTIWDTIERNEVVEQMLKDNIEARFQIQMHKIIWDKDKRGV